MQIVKDKKRKKKQIFVGFLSGAITVLFLEYFGFIYPSLRSRFFYFLSRINRWLTATKTIEEQREVTNRLRRVILREKDEVNNQITVDGVLVEWVVPETDPVNDRVILYLHGGAYVNRTPSFHRLYTQHLANESHNKILMVDYRLAPEFPFPAALNDAFAAYHWLLDQGYSNDQIAIAGDSAGGGLAAATLLYLRDQDCPLPACALLMSPWLDLAGTGNSITRLANEDPQLNWANLENSAASYYGNFPPTHPLISPLYGRLEGLPPLLIIAGGTEILLDDSIRFADRALVAGVDVELMVEPHMGHAWTIFEMVIPEAQMATHIACEFINECISIKLNELVILD